MKRIIICADGTWNRPEKDYKEDFPTNVLKFARGIAPKGKDGVKQIVFYDWGIGSYHDKVGGGAFGQGLEKNVMDGYRFLIHNYEEGDEIYMFGFSRGAYTVRSLSGLINNCNILKGVEGKRVEEAFELYKNPDYLPNDEYSTNWRNKYAIPNSSKIHFVGVWDTVGALGLPFTFFGLIKDKHLFYDNKLGCNIKIARHAMALDELRKDFEPTIWEPRNSCDLKQVWFAGAHADVGGSYAPDKNKRNLSDIPMMWLLKEARNKGLAFDDFLIVIDTNSIAQQHTEYKGMFKLLGRYERKIPQQDKIPTKIHVSVKERYKNAEYTSIPIENYVKDNNGNWPEIED